MTPDQMARAIISKLPERTGKTLEQWVDLARARGPARRNQRIDWLKREHGLSGGQALMVAEYAGRPADYVEPSAEELFAAQYEGSKAALRPIYDRLAAAVRGMGDDVALDPRKTYVSLIRKHQIGVIQATSRARVDLGLKLRGIAPTERLLNAGSFGSGGVTHRVGLGSPDDVDAELLGWLKAAYDADARAPRGNGAAR